MQPISASYDSKGRITRIFEEDHVDPPRSTTIFSARRLDWDRIIASGDPNSRLNGAITDDGTAISAPLKGSWATTDLYGDAPYGVWPLLDPWGRVISGACASPILLMLLVVGGNVNDDIGASIAVVNETDVTSGTVDGRGVRVGFSSASSSVAANSLANGTQVGVVGTASVSVRSVTGMVVLVDNNGANSRLAQTTASSLDANWAFSTSGAGVPSNTTVTFGTGRYYLAMAFYRINAGNAQAKTIVASAYYTVPPLCEFPA